MLLLADIAEAVKKRLSIVAWQTREMVEFVVDDDLCRGRLYPSCRVVQKYWTTHCTVRQQVLCL